MKGLSMFSYIFLPFSLSSFSLSASLLFCWQCDRPCQNNENEMEYNNNKQTNIQQREKQKIVKNKLK